MKSDVRDYIIANNSKPLLNENEIKFMVDNAEWLTFGIFSDFEEYDYCQHCKDEIVEDDCKRSIFTKIKNLHDMIVDSIASYLWD